MTTQKTESSDPDGLRTLVYLVDDEPMVLELAKLILAPHGYELRTFRDPTEALSAFVAADPKPALVVTDYAMGQMNGIELMKRCRKVRPGQRVLLMSGTVGEDICRAVSPGPNAFLAKPFHVEKMEELVWSLTR